MTLGVVYTLNEEIKRGVQVGIVGAIVGAGSKFLKGESGIFEEAAKVGLKAARWGVIFGWETAHKEYNALNARNGEPSVRWYDWVMSNLLMLGNSDRPFSSTNPTRQIIMEQAVNPTTVSGVKDVLHGAVQSLFE
jgi:hypothetical protein